MTKVTPWNQTVLYQVYPWSFKEDEARSPQRGNGTIRGLTEKIPYFVDLGVDAIWVAPPYPGPMVDAGYDTTDMFAIHPDMGTLDDFDEFIAKCHENDMRVMLDFIPNHTSVQHAWFEKSRRRQDGYDDWYIWHPGKKDDNGKRIPPNNWASDFSKPNRKARDRGEMPWLGKNEWTPPISAWQWDDIRGEFYLHHFLVEQADLNWSNKEVREAIKNCMRFWLDRGVDAFRMDAVNHMGKNMDFPDEKINPNYNERDFDNPYYQLQSRVSSNYPDTLHFYVREMCGVVHEDRYKDRDIHITLEAYAEESDLQEVNDIDPEVASTFNFAPFHMPWSMPERKRQMDDYYKNLNEKSVPNQIFGNHDNPRIATRFGDDVARAIAVLGTCAPGMSIIYSGDELGLHDGVVPSERIKDPNGFRDPDRTPIIWDDSQPNAGFSGADPKDLWLPINEDDLKLSVVRQQNNPVSCLSLHKAVIRLRRKSLSLREGKYIPLTTSDDSVFAFERQHSQERMVILVNFSASEKNVNVPVDCTRARVILSSIDVVPRAGHSPVEYGVHLRPNEAVVLSVE